MNKPCTITIEYGTYKWVAVEQSDRETFLVTEYSGDQRVNQYAINENKLDDEISKVLEGSV